MPPEAPCRIRQTFSVPFEYEVVFTRDAFEPGSPLLAATIARREPGLRHRVFVVLDLGLEGAWPELRARVTRYFAGHRERLELAGEPLGIPGGEAAKNDAAVVAHLHGALHRHRMDRHSFVLIVGGGAVQDAAGFAAATAHRGLRVVRMPSTVLAQSDSGVGVKNGYNAFALKNFVGTFAPPFAVVNDARFLEALPRRDRLAGLSEAVKVALIRDAAFFDWIEDHAGDLATAAPAALEPAIRRSAELHLAHIATGGDPFEQGSARPLDFGHWAAHKLETLTAHGLRHGEAVALGLLLDSRYALEAGLLGGGDLERIARLLPKLGLPRWHDALRVRDRDGRAAVLGGLDEFRQHLGGALSITLIRGVGQPVEVNALDQALVERALRWMEAQA